MKICTNLARMRRVRKPVVLAAGFFDGVHLGHRRVIARTLARAAALGAEAWVLTFDRHPLKLLAPAAAPSLLTGNRHKLLLLSRLGLDGCLLLPFTRALAATEAEDFVGRLRACMPGLREVVVGANWRFGRGGRGTPQLLASLARGLNFRVRVVPPVLRGGRPVSSTRIRRAIAAGRMAAAAQLLGRRVSVLGTVAAGRRIGRTLGYPTANLDPHNEVLPPGGVYAVMARLAPGRPAPRAHEEPLLRGVLNFGTRPTFGTGRAARPCIEVHLLGVRRRLYGRDLEVFFVRRLRAERRFASPAALRARIARDVVAAAAALRGAARGLCRE